MRIAQISFFELDVETSYYARKSSKYINEEGATSKIYKDFER